MLKNGDRVDIKMLAWPCRNFSLSFCTPSSSAFRKRSGRWTAQCKKPLQTGHNLTLSALLNKVPKVQKNLRNIVLVHLNRKQPRASKRDSAEVQMSGSDPEIPVQMSGSDRRLL